MAFTMILIYIDSLLDVSLMVVYLNPINLKIYDLIQFFVGLHMTSGKVYRREELIVHCLITLEEKIPQIEQQLNVQI